MKKFIPVNQPSLNGNEKKYLNECIDSGWISSEGPFVEKFESEMSKRFNRKYAVAVTNGTTAIDASIEALDIKAGDEVIMPSFTIISCVLQVVRNGAIPIFIDADPITWNINVNDIENNISHKTKAILIAHIYGLPVDMDPIIKLTKKYKLKLIEDASEMIGQNYKGKSCGSFGDLSTFSFYTNKHITTGEGGMILTNNKKLAEKLKSLRNLCFKPNNRFVHSHMGWNMRMTNMQAALGLAQLERLDESIKKKRYIGNLYRELLKEIHNIQLPIEKTSYAKNIYWVFGIVIQNNSYLNAKKVIESLRKKNISARPFFYPLHKQPIIRKLGLVDINLKLKVSENLYNYGFYIPSGLGIQEDDIERVSKELKLILKS